MELLTKEDLIKALRGIRDRGWIPNARHGNVDGVGNTLKDLLGIEKNNLPIPNAAEWELKCQRVDSASLTTLFHMEPSPRAIRFIPAVLLPKYGWAHQQAGDRYPPDEMSFRQTINGLSRTDRGFGIVIDRESRKVVISFDSSHVDTRHIDWLKTV
ncbi:MAG: MvaI/BcnI family restriction endonuclease, partial [Pseudomonadota bacterium]|nr:MvaI/BcnI family restriction endonuclease [Pseudomonadota bacterium]